MRNNWTLLIVFLLGTTLIAAEPIPSDKRIPATIVGALVPATQPAHMPTDVAVDSKDNIFVADGANDRILRFTPDGHSDPSLAFADNLPLKRPVGLAIDTKDTLWIADSGNRRIVSIALSGQSTTLALPQLDHADRFDPTGIAISPDGSRTCIVDNDGHRLLIRDNKSQSWSTLGGFGSNLGQFQWPFMARFGKDNYLYVSEAIGARVQRISPADRLAGEIGRWGIELGQLYRPKGLAVDKQGRLFISDSTLGVVQVFSERGQVEGILTTPEGRPLRFKHPMGLAFDSSGQLYVVELAANHVAIVHLDQAK